MPFSVEELTLSLPSSLSPVSRLKIHIKIAYLLQTLLLCITVFLFFFSPQNYMI